MRILRQEMSLKDNIDITANEFNPHLRNKMHFKLTIQALLFKCIYRR